MISRGWGGFDFVTQGNPPCGGAARWSEQAKPDLITGIEISRSADSVWEVSINTTVKNVGVAQSPESLCDVVFRNARPPREVVKRVRQKIRDLDPGDVFTFSFTITPGVGMYEVCAFADSKKTVDESDETNNSSCTTLKGK